MKKFDEDRTIGWGWCMDWCKQQGLAPANPDVWKRATAAYRGKDKPKDTPPANTFNLKKALAGEPVVLRNGQKAYVRHHETEFETSYPLIGYTVYETVGSGVSWTVEGNYVSDEKETGSDIVGMWHEPLVFEHWGFLNPVINYIAKDKEELWWGYIGKPIQNESHGEWVNASMSDDSLDLDAFELEGLNSKLFPECNWKDSLIKRPEK